MAKALLAGVANVDLFDISNSQLIVSTKTLTDSSLNMATTGEEARGGQGNVLLGKYYHDSSFGLTLTDQIYDLNYIALNCGGGITAGSDVMKDEQVTCTVANQITISEVPKIFGSTNKIFIWYKKKNDTNYLVKELTSGEANAKVITGLNNLAMGDIVCVKYMKTSEGARKFTVNANYIPSVVYAKMTISLFRTGVTGEALTSSSKIGNLIIDIPNFQLEGAQDLGLTSSGIATVSLSGTALATFDSGSGCDSNGYYAIITEDIFGAGEFDSLSALVVEDSDIQLTVGGKQTLRVYAMYNDGTQPKLIDNAKLTFTSATPATATVETTGEVTGVQAGETNIEVKLAVEGTVLQTAYAVVTVE